MKIIDVTNIYKQGPQKGCVVFQALQRSNAAKEAALKAQKDVVFRREPKPIENCPSDI